MKASSLDGMKTSLGCEALSTHVLASRVGAVKLSLIGLPDPVIFTLLSTMPWPISVVVFGCAPKYAVTGLGNKAATSGVTLVVRVAPPGAVMVTFVSWLQVIVQVPKAPFVLVTEPRLPAPKKNEFAPGKLVLYLILAVAVPSL